MFNFEDKRLEGLGAIINHKGNKATTRIMGRSL